MTRVITITEETIETDTVKNVSVTIDDVLIEEFYSYDISVENSVIESEVNADLNTKGYTE